MQFLALNEGFNVQATRDTLLFESFCNGGGSEQRYDAPLCNSP